MKRVMHRMLITLALGCLLCARVQAHDGTVYINGKINKRTCVVSQDSQALLVKLGSVQSNLFRQAGDGSGYQPFSINLEGCQGTVSNLSIRFTGTPDSQNAALLTLTAEAGRASGLGVGIYNPDKTAIAMGNSSTTVQSAGLSDTVALNFFARYVATGTTVTTGLANASTTFVLNYE